MDCKICGSYINSGLMYKTYKWHICQDCYDDMEEIEVEEGLIITNKEEN